VKKPKRKLVQSGKLAKPRGRGARYRLADEAGDAQEDVLEEKMLRGRENEPALPDVPSQAELQGELGEGQVVAVRGPLAIVAPLETTLLVDCILRKSTRVPHRHATALVVGDFVAYLVASEMPFTLTEVKPRRSRLARRRNSEEQVSVANVDLAVIIASAREPEFKPRLVDRYLLAAREGELEPVLVLNKSDLLSQGEADKLLAIYGNLPFAKVAVSIKTEEGMEQLTGILRGKTSVFAGQSGVGKSSIINALIPDLEAKTGEIQEHTGKGRHTTTASTLYRFPFGGAVVDTPGVRSFALASPSEQALAEFFPEIMDAAARCKFSNCSHRGDSGCAMPEAIRERIVHPDRLESYLALVQPAGLR
jgi:ribosome biogenesis GTPase